MHLETRKKYNVQAVVQQILEMDQQLVWSQVLRLQPDLCYAGEYHGGKFVPKQVQNM